jgi:acyl-CoA dehydrogenase
VSGASGVAIIHHPDIRRMLLTMRAKIMAPRMLAYVAGGWFDIARHHPDAAIAERHRRLIDLLMPVVKAWSSEIGNEVTDTAIQVFGGMGYIEETGVAQHKRDLRISTIYEGTTGIQANDLVGRKVLREGGETLRLLLEEMRGVAAQLSGAGDLAPLGADLAADAATLGRTLDWILQSGKTHYSEVLAGAVPFLLQLGTVCGSWQMGRAALAARAGLAAGQGDAVYLQGIIDLARFYYGHLAPQAASLARVVTRGGATVATAGNAAFG